MAASEAMQRWAVHVQRWRESGLTQAAYCQQHDLNRHTLTYWSWRLRREAETARDVQEATPALLPIRVAMTAVSCGALAAPPDLALTWPSGLRLQLPVATDAGWLAALLRGLGC